MDGQLSIGFFDVLHDLGDTRLALLFLICWLSVHPYILRIGTIICVSKQESVIKCTFTVSTQFSSEIG